MKECKGEEGPKKKMGPPFLLLLLLFFGKERTNMAAPCIVKLLIEQANEA